MTGQAMFLRMIFSSLIRRRSRMFVALLAVIIGGTVFLGMGAVYCDIPRQMGREFRSYGANLVLVSSGTDSILKLEDARRAASLLPVDKVVGASPFRYEVLYYNMQGLTAAGADFDAVKKTSPYWRVQGEWPQNESEILIGSDISEHARLYAGSSVSLEIVPPKGRKITREFKISGIVRTGGVEDGFVLMPLSGMEALMGAPGTANVMELSVAATNEELARFSEIIQAEVPGVIPRPVKRIADSETTVLNKLQVLVYLVTGVVLFLTTICVGTTMMTVVMERRREIGLKKAIGAENKAIICEFLGEGAVLAAVGWLASLGTGYFFAQAVSMSVFSRGVDMPFFLILPALGAALLITIPASLVPVLMAADVEPAVVLRGE